MSRRTAAGSDRFETTFGEVGHRGTAVEPGGKRQGRQIIALPDSHDDERRPLAGLIGIERLVPADHYPPGRSVGLPRPGDVDLTPGDVGPAAKAG